MLVVFSSIGLARFAFGMVLPGMAGDLALDYRQQGILGASYFLGYLVVVSILSRFPGGLGSRRLCVVGLLGVAVGLGGMSTLTSYVMILSSYFIVGVGSGSAFIGAMSLVSQWFQPSHRGRGGGLIVAGAGIAILLSGYLVPRIPNAFDLPQWRLVWFVFSAATLLITLLSAILIRDRPADLGLQAYGDAPVESKLTAVDEGIADSVLDWRFLLHLGAIYALFGATGLTYTTFIVTTMIDEYSITATQAGLLWAIVGGLSIFSGGIFGYLSDQFGHRTGMFCAMTVQAVAFGLVATKSGPILLYISCVLFGISVFSMPAIISAAVGDYLGAKAAAAGFAALTVMFAIGQVLGPAGAGFLADWAGSFQAGFAVAMILNLIAAALCLTLRSVPEKHMVSN